MLKMNKNIKRLTAVATAAAVMISGITVTRTNVCAKDAEINENTALETVSDEKEYVYELDISNSNPKNTLEVCNNTRYGNIKVDINDFDNNYNNYKNVFGTICDLRTKNIGREFYKFIGDCEVKYLVKAKDKAEVTYCNGDINDAHTPIVRAEINYSTIDTNAIKADVTSGNNKYVFTIKESLDDDKTYDVTYSKNGVPGYRIEISKVKKEITYTDPSNNRAVFSKKSDNAYTLKISNDLVKKYGIKIMLNDKEIAPSDSEPTASPTASPTATPTAAPTATPTVAPTATPTATPTVSPTAAPTATPTTSPTAAPTTSPTAAPTASPTASPTPTAAPTASTTATPTAAPANSPDIDTLVSTQPLNSSVALSWTVSNPSSSQTYEILLDGTVYATGVTTTNYTCTGLAAGTHIIKVVAVNGSVRSAGKSVSVSVKMEISIKKNGVSHVYMYDADKPYKLPVTHKKFIAEYPELVTKGYVFDGFLDADRKLVKTVSGHTELTIKWRTLSTKFSSIRLKKGVLTFKFSKADWNNIDGYKISYSTDRKMKKKVKNIAVAKKGSKQVYNFTNAKKKLRNGAIYYFNVKFYYKNKAGKKVFFKGNTTNKPIRYYKK